LPSLFRRSVPILEGASGKDCLCAVGGDVADFAGCPADFAGCPHDGGTGRASNIRTPRRAARTVLLTPRLFPKIAVSFSPLDQMISKTGFHDVAERADFEVKDGLIEFGDHLAASE
jgi:hypothetical protein